jgi:threonine/homoserine/homoserine lactone efflux protein
MASRLRGNLTIWGVLLTVFFLPLIVLGVIFNIKESGWFWGSIQILVIAYVIYFFSGIPI